MFCTSQSPPGISGHSRWLCLFVVGVVFLAGYILVASSCVSLVVRLFLQSTCLWHAFFCVLYGITWYIVKKRTTADYPSQKARIKRCKTIPARPTPPMVQKTYCWVELVDDDKEEEEEEKRQFNPMATIGKTVLAADMVHKDPEQEEQTTQEAIADIRAWSLDHPCIIVSVEENVKIGDVLTVHLQDSDPSRPFYIPHQKATLVRMKWNILKAFVQFCLRLLALRIIFGGLPLFFADSQELEDSINRFWDSVTVYLTETFPSLEDDDDSDNDDDIACRIPPYVEITYDALILMQVFVMVVVPISVYKRTKRLYGMEEPSADSYQLLRGDDEDEPNQRNETDESKAARGEAILL